jgi:hypothetical protein
MSHPRFAAKSDATSSVTLPGDVPASLADRTIAGFSDQIAPPIYKTYEVPKNHLQKNLFVKVS